MFLKDLITKADRHPGVVALLGVGIAYVLYLAQKRDKKRDAAKLILQEIRYAEAKITAYRVHRSYTFTEKILPTNSWHSNIGLFVKELKETELDVISKFYSNAAYLDEVIKAISNKHVDDVLNPIPGIPVEATQLETGSIPGYSSDLIRSISDVIDGASQTIGVQKLTKIAEKKWYHLRWLL